MSLQCQTCGAALQLEAGVRTTVCPYCESAHVLERPDQPDRPNPSLVLGFQLSRADAHQRVRRWLKGRTLFARSGVHQASLDEVRGVYAPAYLYGAVCRAEYRADVGEHYWETVVRGSGKSRRVERVRRTEWRPLAGRFAGYVTDRIVTASRGLRNDEVEAIEPFDLRLLARYQPAVVAGWIAEEPSLTPSECAQLARAEAQQQLDRRLGQFMPGDEHRELNARPVLEAESLDLLMVPIWVFAARYAKDRPPMRILVNGQTGKTWGKVPISWVKISLVALAVVAAIAGLAIWMRLQGRL